MVRRSRSRRGQCYRSEARGYTACVEALTTILAGFGLAGAAGLNAWLPLLVVGMMTRFTHLIQLQAPYDMLASPIVLAVLSVLLAVEVIADKIPAADSVNDLIHTVIRPAAGAVLFAAHNGMMGHMDNGLALALGVLAAGGMHAVKATSRPAVTVSSAGTMGPVVSVIEDVVSAVLAITALVAPALAAVLLALLVFFLWRAVRALRRGLARLRPKARAT